MADTLSPADSNTEAPTAAAHIHSDPIAYILTLSLKSSPDVSFPFRGQRKLNQIYPQGSLFDGESGEEWSGGRQEEGRRTRTVPCLSPLHTSWWWVWPPSCSPLRVELGSKSERISCY
jgi:hypothetical protein